MARFISAAPVSPSTGFQPERRGSTAETKKEHVTTDLGELQVVDSLAGGDTGREEILCSAVVVVERAKRRAMNICGAGLKGPASWGISMSPPGGFV